jgi:hypothetical protein
VTVHRSASAFSLVSFAASENWRLAAANALHSPSKSQERFDHIGHRFRWLQDRLEQAAVVVVLQRFHQSRFQIIARMRKWLHQSYRCLEQSALVARENVFLRTGEFLRDFSQFKGSIDLALF